MFFCEMHFSIVLTVLVLLGSVFFYFMEWLAPSPDQPKDGDVINEDLLTDEERVRDKDNYSDSLSSCCFFCFFLGGFFFFTNRQMDSLEIGFLIRLYVPL